MNILTDRFPTAVEIDGCEYALNTDFRNCLRINLAFEDPELTGDEKQEILLRKLYTTVPENVEKAIELGVKFLDGGNEGEYDDNATTMRLYSLQQDANFIFAAFKQTHGVDLETTEMHWWKFLAFFMDLGADTTFCNLTNLRKRLATGEATEEEKKLADTMRSVVELHSTYEPPLKEYEIEDKFMQLLAGGK